ncbi:MAG TPA: type II toxin-antitoxin system VapC family toxin [Gemmatimonadota bacterium]|nr:type II toxin-antitoxin system VapC family toxin [Gemmatimonadota bacterium]
MRFWDASAIVPLCLNEPRTENTRSLYADDPEITVWWGTPVECVSAFARMRREAVLDEAQEASARTLLTALSSRWLEVPPTASLREQALRTLRHHPLKAADSLQLAAAMEWAGVPTAGEFVAFDDRLRTAARIEGFTVAPG